MESNNNIDIMKVSHQDRTGIELNVPFYNPKANTKPFVLLPPAPTERASSWSSRRGRSRSWWSSSEAVAWSAWSTPPSSSPCSSSSSPPSLPAPSSGCSRPASSPTSSSVGWVFRSILIHYDFYSIFIFFLFYIYFFYCTAHWRGFWEWRKPDIIIIINKHH